MSNTELLEICQKWAQKKVTVKAGSGWTDMGQ